jgi:hypothetical protein
VTASTIDRPVPLGGGAGRSAFIGQRRVAMTLPLCLELVDAVRCADRPRVGKLVGLVDHAAALVVLAAMVDQDATPAQLLGWTDELVSRRQTRQLRAGPLPCGTHAAFNRHRRRNEEPCTACEAGEREYQRKRNLNRAPRRKAAV